MTLKNTWKLTKRAIANWSNDNISVHGAALSFYTVFSVAPLLVIAIAIAGFAFGPQASRGEIFKAIQSLVGPEGARGVENLVKAAASRPHAGSIATLAGLAALFIGASGVFQQLQQSLNMIWRVTTEPGKGLGVFIRRRLLTFSMVLAIGFILLVTLLISAAISALGEFLGGRLPGGELFWHFVHSLVSFGVTAVLFAAILKILPDVKLAWKDVWLGSAVTALLFTLGKLVIGLYLGHSSVASSYGAAGSLVIVLLWVYYASQILLFGAEFTRAYTELQERRISAKAGAKLTEPKSSEEPARAA